MQVYGFCFCLFEKELNVEGADNCKNYKNISLICEISKYFTIQN